MEIKKKTQKQTSTVKINVFERGKMVIEFMAYFWGVNVWRKKKINSHTQTKQTSKSRWLYLLPDSRVCKCVFFSSVGYTCKSLNMNENIKENNNQVSFSS